jgi:ABC-type dipeptide/oligopeptide/nickel transport system ATPase component
VEFATRRGTVQAVAHVDISVARGETLAIVGESGSGKSVMSYAVMRILDHAGRIAGGTVRYTSIDLRQAARPVAETLARTYAAATRIALPLTRATPPSAIRQDSEIRLSQCPQQCHRLPISERRQGTFQRPAGAQNLQLR